MARVTSSKQSTVPLYLTLILGGTLRLLLALTRLPELLTDRNELTTPITSWRRCKSRFVSVCGVFLNHWESFLGLNVTRNGKQIERYKIVCCFHDELD